MDKTASAPAPPRVVPELGASRLRLALAIAFATSVASLSGVSLLYPILPLMAGDLGVDESRIGLLIAAFTLPAVFLAPLFGVLADLKGRRWLLIGGLAVFAVCGAAGAFAPSFEWLLALRFLQGIGVSAITPLTIVLISDLLPEEKELKAQGHKVVIDRIAMIALPLMAGAIAVVSWRYTLLTWLAVLPLALAAWAWMPETRAEGSISLSTYLKDTAGALTLSRVRLGFLVGFLRFFLDYGMFIYLPLLLGLRLNASPVTIGWVLALTAAGAIFTAASVGRIAAWQPAPRLLTGAFIACGASLATMGLWVDLRSASIAAFVFGLGNGLISPLQKSLLTRSAPAQLRGGVISVDRVIQQIAKSLSPALIGLALLAISLETVFLSLGAVGLAGAAAIALSGSGSAPGPATPTAREQPNANARPAE